MSFAPLLVSAAAGESSGVNPYLVGAGVLALFVALVLGLLAFGAGRDHS
jgi:hypothetical protein